MRGIAACKGQLNRLYPVNAQLTCWIPSTQNYPTICGVLSDLADAFRELVNTLSGIIGIAGLVFSAEMSPLKTVDGSKVPLAPVSEPALL